MKEANLKREDDRQAKEFLDDPSVVSIRKYFGQVR
jgi:hypothetical protein